MPHVLVCGQEPVVNGLLLQVLSRQGYEVVLARDFEDALRELGNSTFRLLLLGIRGDIQEIKNFILRVRALHREMPLITMVDEDSLEVQKMIRKEKIFYHLVGPFEEEEIVAAVRGALSKP